MQWDDISSTQQKYYTRKAREIFAATLSVVSLGQDEALWESLRREPMLENEGTVAKKRKYFDVKSDLIDALTEAHNQAQSWQTKGQILSLFANDFSRLELQKMIPGLDQARNHATETAKGQPILEKPIYRERIENANVDHFLDYISRPELFQDVAFGMCYHPSCCKNIDSFSNHSAIYLLLQTGAVSTSLREILIQNP